MTYRDRWRLDFIRSYHLLYLLGKFRDREIGRFRYSPQLEKLMVDARKVFSESCKRLGVEL